MDGNEIVKALRACARRDCGACTCYQAGLNCDTKNTAAADLIEKQERQIQTLKASLSAMEQDLRRAASSWDGCLFCAHFCNDGKPIYRPDERYLEYCEKCDEECCCLEWRGILGTEDET